MPGSLGASGRILFYPHSARALTSSLIGHLHEVSQQHPVVLFTEPLPEPYLAHLRNRDLFPGLERVEVVRSFGFSVSELLSEHRRCLHLARGCIDEVSPSLVIGENDMSSMFDMHLMREAKRLGLPTLTIQSMGQLRDGPFRSIAELNAVYVGGKEPPRPLASARRWKYRARKELGHFLVHYLLPWSAGQPALRGASSYVRRAGVPGMRDSDLHLVQSAPQLKVFTEAGVPTRKLGILRHPAARIASEVFFPPGALTQGMNPGARRRILVLLSPQALGIERGSLRVISGAVRRRLRLAILTAIQDTLPDWEIIVKAHPDFGSIRAVRAYLGTMPANVSVADPSNPVEPYLPICHAILDLPAPTTSALVTAVSTSPLMPVIAADLDRDVLGDQYSDWPEVDYVDSMEALTDLLESIRDGRYRRRPAVPDDGSPVKTFDNTCQAVRFVRERLNQ